jgi:putative oxidoreductase
MSSASTFQNARSAQPATLSPSREVTTTSWLMLFGRLMFAAIFVMSGPRLFTQPVIGYAASQGVPFANFLVPFAGALALAGGLSILLGYRARIGAWMLVLFLVPVTLMLHRFWGIADPMVAQMQMANFMKNVALIGGSLLISQFGAGSYSLDARRGAADKKPIERAQSTT